MTKTWTLSHQLVILSYISLDFIQSNNVNTGSGSKSSPLLSLPRYSPRIHHKLPKSHKCIAILFQHRLPINKARSVPKSSLTSKKYWNKSECYNSVTASNNTHYDTKVHPTLRKKKIISEENCNFSLPSPLLKVFIFSVHYSEIKYFGSIDQNTQKVLVVKYII